MHRVKEFSVRGSWARRNRREASVSQAHRGGSPQYEAEALGDELELRLVCKVETANPIRSIKGRGTDYFMHRMGGEEGRLVCASAGNFGQGLAYAARKRGVLLTVFAAESTNPAKVKRMRRLGAEVRLEGADFDETKAAARAGLGKDLLCAEVLREELQREIAPRGERAEELSDG
jgi:threonine dehydratase